VRSELEEAIVLLRKADAASVDRAVELLQRTVFSFGMKVCGHREDAEDTAQEVLVKSLPHLAKLDDPRALSAWLYTAARNRCWQGRRKLSRRKEVALEELMPDGAELSALLAADPGKNPEMQAQSREDHQLLHQAVLRLPPQYRIVLVLHDMEELDTDLVARILSLERGTVRVRLHRARLMVRKEMGSLMRRLPQKPSAAKASRQRPAECREIFANLSQYLDGELAPENCERMRRHIEACPSCVAFIQDLKRAIDRCRSLDVCPDAEAPPALVAAATLRRLLTEEYLRLVKNSPSPL
jgi:RNA polymerase sigma-70 factor (ECF subfamily)